MNAVVRVLEKRVASVQAVLGGGNTSSLLAATSAFTVSMLPMSVPAP
jgi:hypothetical protein